ncbi:MAG: tetratricopeptide repeat protein [SAR324 cluster bacterium]|nr:tetratricopeptide repeat protein [SAR324 cluster bacterium]
MSDQENKPQTEPSETGGGEAKAGKKLKLSIKKVSKATTNDQEISSSETDQVKSGSIEESITKDTPSTDSAVAPEQTLTVSLSTETKVDDSTISATEEVTTPTTPPPEPELSPVTEKTEEPEIGETKKIALSLKDFAHNEIKKEPETPEILPVEPPTPSEKPIRLSLNTTDTQLTPEEKTQESTPGSEQGKPAKIKLSFHDLASKTQKGPALKEGTPPPPAGGKIAFSLTDLVPEKKEIPARVSSTQEPGTLAPGEKSVVADTGKVSISLKDLAQIDSTPPKAETPPPAEAPKLSLSGMAPAASTEKKPAEPSSKVKVSLSSLAGSSEKKESDSSEKPVTAKTKLSLSELSSASGSPTKEKPATAQAPLSMSQSAPKPQSAPSKGQEKPIETDKESSPQEKTSSLSDLAAPQSLKPGIGEILVKLLGTAAVLVLLAGLGWIGYTIAMGPQDVKLSSVKYELPPAIELDNLSLATVNESNTSIASASDDKKTVVAKAKPKPVLKPVQKVEQAPAPAQPVVTPEPPMKEEAPPLIATTETPPQKKVSKWFERGVRYQKNSEWEKATHAYEKALEETPKDPDVYNNLGVVYQNQGETDKALVQYEKSLELDPDSVKTLNNAGSAYMVKQNWEKAEQMFRSAMATDLEQADSYANLALVYKKNHKLNESEAVLHQTLTIFPKYALAYYYLGQVYEEQKMRNEARWSYEQFLQFSQNKELNKAVENHLNNNLR